MAEQIGVATAEEATKNLIKIVWKQIQYLRKYDDNINKLKEKVKDLESKKGTVEQSVDECKRKGEEIGMNVKHWFEKVDKVNEEAKKLLEKATALERTSCLSCCVCSSLCPPILARYRLSKEACDKTSKVIQLENEGDFQRVGYEAPPKQMPFISPKEFHGVESHTTILSDILQSLKDDSITRIGIHGPAGVGKTTLVKKIGDEAKANKLFHEVLFAVVSRDPIEKVQDQLAESLGLKFSDNETCKARANRIYTQLVNEEKRVLIILDDLWEELVLHEIGIPVRRGLTVVLTSRFQGVCTRMDCHPNSIEIPILEKDEARTLFKKAAEISDDAIEKVANEVADRCGGLPLAIMVIGKALRDKKEHAWRDALEQLKERTSSSIHGMNDVHSRIKWSYDYLQSVQSKKLLLLCALYPEDYKIPVEDLVRYAKGLQLFGAGKTLEKSRDRVRTLTDELKSCYLLLPGYDEKHVKLHDVVRDVGLSIVSSGEEVYKVMHTGLKEWPQMDCVALTCISLTFDCGKRIQFPNKLRCPNLKLLRLVFRGGNERVKVDIPDDFFQEMKELQVLEIIELKGKVPSSLKSLVNLRILLLIKCILTGDISSVITSLNNLEMIDLHDSTLNETSSSVPIDDHVTGLEHALEFIDLRFKKGPSIASAFLMRLNKLEELYLGDIASNYLASASGDDDEDGGVFINLQKLDIYGAHQLRQLSCGNLPTGSFANLSILQIIGCPSISSLFSRSSLKCFQQLKRIETIKCKGLEVIIHDGDDDDQGDEGKGGELVDLPRLQHLEMVKLKSFKGFDNTSTRGALFGKVVLANLKTLYIRRVENIKCIVSSTSGSMTLLQKLEELYIDGCSSLKIVFDFEGLNYIKGAHVETDQTPLGCLQKWSLLNLAYLECLWRMPPAQGIHHHHQHAFRNLKGLLVWGCHSLTYLLSPSMAKLLVGLETLNIRGCDKMEAIILETENEKDTVMINEIEFPKLTHLYIRSLRNLRMIMNSGGNELKLPSLTELVIDDCPMMTKFCTGQLTATQLSHVQVDYKDEGQKVVSLDEFDSWLKACESKIKCLNCSKKKTPECTHLV